MMIRIEGWDGSEREAKIAMIDAWYDRHTRLWVVQKLDEYGYQVGDAKYVYGKKDAMLVKKQLEEECGI